ncbi:MFS transporter [Bacillus sp. Marseille-P3661]|uniref:MFS transporter n=1 Tax=Bacillus sp. Marseille-P3661 TaxID=1936234 RepID=UPI000C846A20|nr:MFS transporter [Bacillus sp. Marseille-P3661]
MYYCLLFLHLIYAIALHGSKPIVSLYADSLGASTILIGILVAAYSVFPMLIAIKVGKWLDHHGAKKLLLSGATLIIFAVLCPVFLPNITGLFILQILFGIAQIFVNVSIQKTVGNLEGSRDQLIATLSFVASSGGLIGPLLCGYTYEHLGFKSTYIALFVLVLISWLFVVIIPAKNYPKFNFKQQVKQTSSFSLLKKVSLRNALIISGLSIYSKDLFAAYFPILASDKGLSASTIGLLLSLSAGASMVVRLLQAVLVHRFGRGSVLLTTLILSGISYLAIPFLDDPIIMASFVVLLGAGLGLGQPLSLVYALNSSPPERQGEVLGLRLTFNRAAQVIAPLMFGAIGGLSGVKLIFWASGAILFIGTYFTRTSANEEMPDEQLVKSK